MSFSAKVLKITQNSPLCDVTLTSLGMSRDFSYSYSCTSIKIWIFHFIESQKAKRNDEVNKRDRFTIETMYTPLTTWMAVVISTDRPKSVRNRYAIGVFGNVLFVLSRCFLEFSVDLGVSSQD